MIQICNTLTIKEYNKEELTKALNMCECCKWYYSCDEVLSLNDKLKYLEEE